MPRYLYSSDGYQYEPVDKAFADKWLGNRFTDLEVAHITLRAMGQMYLMGSELIQVDGEWRYTMLGPLWRAPKEVSQNYLFMWLQRHGGNLNTPEKAFATLYAYGQYECLGYTIRATKWPLVELEAVASESAGHK